MKHQEHRAACFGPDAVQPSAVPAARLRLLRRAQLCSRSALPGTPARRGQTTLAVPNAGEWPTCPGTKTGSYRSVGLLSFSSSSRPPEVSPSPYLRRPSTAMLRQAPILRNRLCPRATVLGDALSESPGVESLGGPTGKPQRLQQLPEGARVWAQDFQSKGPADVMGCRPQEPPHRLSSPDGRPT